MQLASDLLAHPRFVLRDASGQGTYDTRCGSVRLAGALGIAPQEPLGHVRIAHASVKRLRRRPTKPSLRATLTNISDAAFGLRSFINLNCSPRGRAGERQPTLSRSRSLTLWLNGANEA
jgi:hypothetical protein